MNVVVQAVDDWIGVGCVRIFDDDKVLGDGNVTVVHVDGRCNADVRFDGRTVPSELGESFYAERSVRYIQG